MPGTRRPCNRVTCFPPIMVKGSHTNGPPQQQVRAPNKSQMRRRGFRAGGAAPEADGGLASAA
jgi:hypothetical protein